MKLKATATFALAATLAVAATGLLHAQGAPGTDGALRVATFDGDAVLHSYHGLDDFNQQMQGLQQEFQRAQEAQDQEALMQLQARAQQAQTELLESLESDISDAARDLSRENGVHVVAQNVVYVANDAETVDLTADLIEKVNEGVERPEPQGFPMQ